MTWASNSTPTDQELYLADNLSIAKTKNKFGSTNMTRLGICTKLPTNADTSFPIKLNMVFVCDNNTSGDIEWRIRYAVTIDGSNIYHNTTDAPADAAGVLSVTKITSIGTNKKDMDIRETINVDVSTFSANPSDGKDCVLWVSIERDADVSNTNDTYAGSASLALITSSYVCWNNGNHLLGF